MIVVPEAPPEAASGGTGTSGPARSWDPSPAEGGDVPPPRASSAGVDAQLPLALAAGSLLLPVLGPLAWWLVQRASEPIRARGEEEPDTIRHARFMAMTGTALLGLVLLCCGPMLLVIG